VYVCMAGYVFYGGIYMVWLDVCGMVGYVWYGRICMVW
jgi:hypothetical protein